MRQVRRWRVYKEKTNERCSSRPVGGCFTTTYSNCGWREDGQVRVLMAFVENLANSVDRQLTADEYETLFREWLQECSQGGVESLTPEHAETELSLLFYNTAKCESWSDENMSSTLITFVQQMFWKHQDHEVIGSFELKEEFSEFLETAAEIRRRAYGTEDLSSQMAH